MLCGGVYLCLHRLDVVNALMLFLLLCHHLFGVHQQLFAVVGGQAVRIGNAVNEPVVVAVHQ